jgi:hypothetical protein
LNPIRLTIALTAALTLVLGLTATAAAAGSVSLRFVNVEYPTNSIDLYIDGSLAFSDVNKGEVTDPVKLPAGDHLVRVTQAGDYNNYYAEKTVTLTPGAWTLVSWSPGGGLTLQADTTETVTGSSLLRIWDFSYSLMQKSGMQEIAEGSQTLASVSLPYPTAYLQFDPGAHTLKVIKPSNGAVLFRFTVDLESDTNYTVFLYDVAAVPHAKLVVDATTVSNTAVATSGTNGSLPVSLILVGILTMALGVGTASRRRRLG